MAKKTTNISTEQWERFQKHVVFWQVTLGLQDWSVMCLLADKDACAAAKEDLADDDATVTIAWVCDDYENHIATVFLRKDWGNFPIRQEEIDKAAFHEMCHLLFGPLERQAKMGATDEAVSIEVHRLIRVMENTFYEDYRRRLGDVPN